MLNIQQFRELIVRATLEYLGMHSLSAEELIMGTVAQESRFTHLKQMGAGTALGLFQMEPATHDDHWTNYLAYNRDLSDKIKAMAPPMYTKAGSVAAHARCMIGNLEYACAMAAIHYKRRKVDFNAMRHDDIEALAATWKKKYNTVRGKGTTAEFVSNYHLLVQGKKGGA